MIIFKVGNRGWFFSIGSLIFGAWSSRAMAERAAREWYHQRHA